VAEFEKSYTSSPEAARAHAKGSTPRNLDNISFYLTSSTQPPRQTLRIFFDQPLKASQPIIDSPFSLKEDC
jgi:hypothetical protein